MAVTDITTTDINQKKPTLRVSVTTLKRWLFKLKRGDNMGSCNNYPANPIEFIKRYSFKDTDQIYTNGAELVPLFIVEEMLEHYMHSHKLKGGKK